MPRFALLATAVILALVTWSAEVSRPQPVVASDDGLVISASARYEIEAAARAVRVTVDAAVTNVTPDTATQQTYYTGITVPAPAGASAVRAQAGGIGIGAAIAEATDEYTAIDVTFGHGVFYQQTYRFELSFELADGQGARGQEVRVGSSFAAFPVWAFGSAGGESSVEVVIPLGYEATLVAGELDTMRGEGGATLLTASAIADPTTFAAYVAAERAGSLDGEVLALEVGGRSARVIIYGWADDPAWMERTRPVFEEGLPMLGEAIGLAYPITGPLTIYEQAFAGLGDYGGLFDLDAQSISIRYDTDAFVSLHEAAHIWFNDELSAERWIEEAFASYYAELVGSELGLEMEIFEVTPDVRAAAFPLNDWGEPYAEELAREDYAYPATLEVARQIAALAGDDVLREVWQAADADALAYQPGGGEAPESGLPDSTIGWMHLLDLLEEHADADFDPIWEEWIVEDAELARLADREAARATYADALRAAGDWSLPRPLRLAMESWDFDDALALIDGVGEVLADRTEIETRAERLDLEPPDELREAFEAEIPDIAAGVAAAQLEALAAIERAASRLDVALAPVELVGLLGEANPADALDDARASFVDGAADEARSAATAALEARGSAADRGRLRVTIGGGVLLALDGGAMAALVFTRRHRIARATPPAISA